MPRSRPGRGPWLRLLGRPRRPHLHPVLDLLRGFRNLTDDADPRGSRLPPRRLGGLPGPHQPGRQRRHPSQFPQRLQRRRRAGRRLGIDASGKVPGASAVRDVDRAARAARRTRMDPPRGDALRLRRKPRRPCHRGIAEPRARGLLATSRLAPGEQLPGPLGPAEERHRQELLANRRSDLALRPGRADHAARATSG